MAITPPLRPGERSAETEGSAELRAASPVRGAALAAVAAALFLLVTLLVAGVDPGAPVFLRDALGPEVKDAPLERSPAPGVDVSIDDDGYTVKRGGSSVSVEAEDTSGEEWERYAHGASRPTDFGTETIVVDGTSTESFLTVTERQGPRTWRWKLGTRLVPRLGRDGGVSFFDPTRHRDADIGIDPAAVLDSDGKDITPEGVGWELVLDGGEWWLTLELNDAELPLPYVIDPAADYASPLYLSSQASAVTNSWRLVTGAPAALNTTTDNVPCRNCTGYWQWRPGASNSTAGTPSTTPTGRGWIVDTAGATGFPAGNWSFTVTTDIPDATLVAGTAVLTVGVWKGTVSGGNFSATQTLLPPASGTTNLRTSVNPVTTTETFALPKFSLAAGERLYVEYWRNQTGGINNNNAARRSLDFHVNDGVARIVHPPADDAGPLHSLSVVELTNAGGQHFDSATGTHYYSTASGGTFRVDDAATDAGSGVLRVDFPAVSLTGFTHTAASDAASPYQSNTYTWTNANTTSPGAQTIVAEDNALNTSSPSPQLTIMRDVTGPGAFSLAAPTAGAAIRNGQTVSAAPSDSGAGLASVEFRYCPGATCTYAAGTTIGSPDTSAPYSVTWNSQPADGTYTLLARATDNVGNTTDSAQRTVTVDNGDPGAVFDFPAAASVYNAAGWNAGCAASGFCGTASDVTSGVAGVEISIERESSGLYWSGGSFSIAGESFLPATLAGSSWSYAFSASSFAADGDYTVHVRATDVAGNVEAGPMRTFTIDSAAPQTTLDSSPADPTGSASADFDFSASEPGSTFECELDGSGFSPCSSPRSYSSLTDGSHTFKVRATDAAGNVDSTPASYTWTVDTAAPETTVDSTLADPSGSSSADFDFSASEPGSTFECELDGSGFSACTSPESYAGLADGPHTFRVRATDAVGNTDPTPASFTWTVDTAAPQTTIDSNPADPTNATGADFDFSSSESGSTFECELDGGGFSACTSPESYAGLANGSHTFRVRATDAAENTDPSPAPYAWAVDTVDPTGSLTAPADGAFLRGTVAVSSDSADAASGVDSVLFERRPAGGGAWTPITTDASAPYSADWDTGAAADGDHELRAVTTDAAGNTFTSATRTVTVDNTAPSSAVLDALPAAIRNGQVLTGSGADAGSGVDSLTYLYCAGSSCAPASPIGSSSSGPDYSATWSSQPADGDHQVLARVTDRAGNTLDSAKQTVTVDNTSPTGSLTAPADAAIVSGTVAVSSDSADAASGVDSVLFERRASGGGAWTAIGTDSTAPYSVGWDTAPLVDGGYDLRAVTTDAAGNTFTSTTRTVVADNYAPTVSLTAPSGYVNATAPDPFTVTATSPDGDLTGVELFRCSNASAGCAAGSWVSLGTDATEPYSASWAIDGDGNRALRAVATDAASNTAEDVVDVTIDRTAPSGSLTAPANGAFVSGTITVASDSTDGGSGVGSVLFESRPSGGGAWAPVATDATTPYSADWDASALAGDFDLRAVTSDAAGNSTVSATRTVTVDNVPPSAPAITLDESSPFAHVSGSEIFLNTNESGSYDVSATASDADSGIERVSFPWGVDDTSSPYEAGYTFGDLTGSQAVTAFDRAGNSAASTFTVTADTTGPDAFALTAPGPGATIANGQAVTASPADAGAGVGSVEFRYCAGTSCSFGAGTPIGADASAPFSVVWSGQPADETYTLVARATDHVGNVTVSNERVVTVDNSGPSGSLDVVEGAAPERQWLDAGSDTLYYNPAGAGDFTVTVSASDPMGVQSVDFPSVSETGFGGPALADSTSPYESDVYAFTSANIMAPADASIVVTDALGNTTSLPLAFARDVVAPVGGSVSYADGYDADGQVIVTVDPGADALSGVDGASAVLERRTASLNGGACDPFAGAWSTVTSPDNVASGLCAQYRYRISDRVGNEAVHGSSDVVEVDLVDPTTPTLNLSEASPYAHVSGSEIFLNTIESGTYDIEAASGDAVSGIEKVRFPGGVDDATAPYRATYSFPDLSGPQTVTAFDNAGNNAGASFTVTEDTDAPSGGSVSYGDGYDTDGQVTVTVDPGADALSGVDGASAVLERRTASLNGGACDPFAGAWSTVTSPDNVASGLCAQYRYRVSDRVGNEAVHTSADVVRVDLTAPAQPALTLSEASPHAHVSGSEIFLNTNESGTYDVEATSGDAQSGIDEVRFPNGSDDSSSPYQAAYAFGDLAGVQSVSAFNGAGLSSSQTFTVTADTAAPSTSDDTSAIGSGWRTAPVTVTLAPSDAGAGVAATYYTTDGSLPTTSSPEGTSVSLSADGVHTIRYFSVDRVGNAEPVQTASTQIRIDGSDPSTPDLTLFETSPGAHVSGDEIFVNTDEAGTYTVSATAADATSGVEKIRFPGPLDDSTSPYSAVYSFGDLSGAQSVAAFDHAGNTSSNSFAVTPDTAAPAGGSISYPDGYDADGDVTVTVDAGTDALSGVDASSGVLERRTAPLTGGGCDPFAGPWSAVTSPDTVPTESCAQYRYRVSDRVGNEVVHGSGNVVRVDLSAPETTIDAGPADPSANTSPGFQFSSSEPGSTFACELDGGGFAPCTSPEGYAGLADGTHTFRVRATDAAGNADPSPATHAWTVDTAAPDTNLDSVPADPSDDDSPSFAFSADEPSATFECELDGGGFATCTTPQPVGPLADGSHTFRVRATDGAGNADPTPASRIWTVDTTPPDTSFTVVPADPSNDPAPAFEFAAGEPGSSFECELDGGGFAPCASPQPVGPLADGTHTLAVRATDAAGNTDATPASYTWAVNAVAPTVSVTEPSGFVNAADADPFTLRATSPDGDVAGVEFFRCSDSSDDCDTGTWVSLGTDASAPFEASWAVDADGNRALRALATDLGSNTGEDVVDVTIDRTLPATTVDSAPADPSASAAASFAFSASEAATFECELDGSGFAPCAGPASYTGLADGSHTFRVRAVDLAGNVEAAPQAVTWSVDTAAPQTAIDVAPADPSASAAPTFEFSASEPGASFECELDGGGFAPCASPESYAGLADGSHTFRVRATDAAGNVDSTPASHTWTIDATPPGGGLADPGANLRGTVGLSAAPSDTGAGVRDVEFQLSPAGAGTWTTIAVDAAAPYTADWDTTGAPDGLYDLRVVVTDNAGNTTPSAEVEDRRIDNTAPSATMDDPGAHLRAGVTLTATVSDAGSGVASVAFERSAAGAAAWTTTAASWDTTAVADGLYDLRAIVTDAAGNSTVSAPVTGRRVDNQAPAVSSSAPADGATVGSAGSLQLVATEDVAGLANATIDGAPAVGAVVSGSTLTWFAPFVEGPHTLAGELEDVAGNRRPVRVHFTVWSLAGADHPYVEKNCYGSVAISLRAASDSATVTMPAGAWAGAPAGDWLVLRVDPQPAGAVPAGFRAAGDVLDVTAYWALDGSSVHEFDQPLEIEFDNAAGHVVPATFEGGSWRSIPAVPSATTLPAGWADGFYRDGANVVVLTRHLSSFSLLEDVEAPTVPKGFRGTVARGKLTLAWKGSSDSSGIARYRVYANGSVVRTVGANARSAAMGRFRLSDRRSFQVSAEDVAGNASARSFKLKVVPKVIRLPLAGAKSALARRGFKVGKVRYERSAGVPRGSVIRGSASGLLRAGSKVGLTVSAGSTPSAPRDAGTVAPPPASSAGTTPPPPAPSAPPTALLGPPAPAPTAVPTAGAEAPSASGDGPSEIRPEPLAVQAPSAVRKPAGYVLLVIAFGAAALAAVRLLLRSPRAQTVPGGIEPLLLWDARLLRLAATTLRRVAWRP